MNDVNNNNFSILVVDDEEVVFSLVRDALEDEGFNVDTAINSFAALDIINSKKIDLLITDIRMPKMSGIELVKKVKIIQPDIAFIFMTGYANLNSAKDAIKQGASDYILKPFELNEIRQSVKKAIDKLKENIKADKSEKQLDRLSDLHHMLFTAADKTSLVNMSLKFSLMQFKSQHGGILSWDSDRTNFKLICHNNNKIEEFELDDKIMLKCIDSVDLDVLQNPVICSSFNEYPLIKSISDQPTIEKIESCFEKNNSQIIFVPISRTYSIYGLMMVCIPSKSNISSDNDLKFLSITSYQLAMSLENLELLKESQKAYTKLKEVQDDTIQLEKMATRGEISAEIGHELNNFLGVVAGSLSLMDFQIQKENYNELNRYIQIMNENIQKMKQFTTNLMDLRSISTKKEIIKFDELLSDVIEYLTPQKRFDGVDISFSPANEQLLFDADPTHIQQLLYNLLNNSADAMKGRSLKKLNITTSINIVEESFEMIIEDTGSGFSQENLEKAFKEKFTSKAQGHGFGLLVCQRIIESHLGKLKIESMPDIGTKIMITFPLCISGKKEPQPV